MPAALIHRDGGTAISPERVNAIDWTVFETAYGNAASEHKFTNGDEKTAERWGSIADQLLQLSSTDGRVALEASHHLWCCLSHQHAYAASAALPALPFLLHVLDDANDALAIELLDILRGLTTAARGGFAKPAGAWIEDLWNALVAERSRFEALAHHANEGVAGQASAIVEELTKQD